MVIINIFLILLTFILSIFFVIISNKLFDKQGLKYIYIIYNILAFILSLKIMNILNIDLNSNIIISSCLTLLNFLFIEKTSIKEYKQLVKQTLTVNIIVSLALMLTALYVSSINDPNIINIKYVLQNNYKIILSYPIINSIYQLITLIIYDNIKQTNQDIKVKMLLSSLNCIMIESILFNLFSYIFTLNFKEIYNLIINNYLIKVIITNLYIILTSYLIKTKKVKL